MKRSLFAAGLFSTLALTACTAPTPPPGTGAPSSPEQPIQNAQVEGNYILDLQKPSGVNLRLWIYVNQTDTTLTGKGYAGYV